MAGAGAGEDDAAWERAISAAVKSAPLSPFSAPKTLTFDRFPSLEELSVAGARLSSLAGLPRLPALRRLSLPDNRLAGADSLAAVAESCGGTIRHLDLGNNRFAAVEELAPLAPLGVESLDLYQCPVTKLKGYREKVFALVPSLKYLDGVDAEGNDRLESDEDEEEDEDEDEEEDEEGAEDGEGEGEEEDGEEEDGDEEEDGEEEEGDEDEDGDEAGDEEDEAEDDEPDSGAAEKSEVANGNKSAGSALPIKRKRDNEDAAGGDN
ncbi:unnamed protein product [Triticum turgidum subsp. durum]|uniref:U2A'/phosphoprotein 32 family A C-terminal domain-containing protein n=1 Tax=Triticum turgidum subsp. durum TaxID=4567 RepID=A0A9R0W223_TRITD|nr:unnamed protein product [Triticum turgidum subsp. durum]